MYNIIKLAAELGAESVFVDRFESGGLGSKLAKKLSPSIKQFKIALRQMVKAKEDFGIPLGFGTAIPFCIDPLMLKENIKADCGVGVTFAAINPQGDVRICNQSQRIYGNVLKEPLEKIWNKKQLNDFRNLKWVSAPCKKCSLLYDCVCGCKVDTTCPGEFCVDYAVRNLRKPLTKVKRPRENFSEKDFTYPKNLRRYKNNKYFKLNDNHKEDYIVTRYQTIKIDKNSKTIVKFIISKRGIILEKDILDKFSKQFESKKVRRFLTKLEFAGAIDKI